ncbi:DUF2059 domain-containing protein [Marinomonas mediterranea]|jgi:Uncharacterized protein conserved in bacteria|uniref:DUF2059 domain-containing protein n=1 Tax=Marinomonas mediterranea (strain ATCC 700492 / JCM 21426 / NBRC 103028 / MMB-1) TaxID=717774 RepID=F2K0G6_MARM1|nr:DUF2059 domain-containing protein [Marinomonas mediterranea]ADZ90950.1 Protein of unknown function DUF2059 [Marinomonas mediterranea MMB-1]WCN08986.1 DUF2059 domain-containing protein [Marinomonas mediterranea]WCN13020.1 DUF2059 domain-containing protein [Marinomonas mediterranea]WCN17093.1 DUF2059 domain-containing protein [Marinomonas mediterranea MMB-1]
MKKTFINTAFVIFTAVNSLHLNAASASKESVEEFFKVIKMEEQMTGGFEAMMPAIDQLSIQLKLNQEEKSELLSIYLDWFENDIDRPKVINELVSIYSQAFSEEEIISITDFYRTPAGMKFTEKSPELMGIAMQIGVKEGQSKQHLLIEKLTPFIEAHDK